MVHVIVFSLALVGIARSACPSACNGRGVCESSNSASCKCPLGFTGDDCEVAHCPRGDDLETTGQKVRAIELSVTQGPVAKNGMLALSFLNDSVALPAPPNLNSAICKRAVSSLRGVDRAQCVQQSSQSFVIRFLEWSPEPFDTVVPHLGDPPITWFGCDGSAAGVGCELRDVVTGQDVREHVECSNHGACNRNTGACACVAGWYGTACELQHDSADVKILEAKGPYFSGAVLRLHTYRQADAGFSFMEAQAGDGDKLFEVNGEGLLEVQSAKVHGSLEVSGSSTFRPEGLNISGIVTTTHLHVHKKLIVGGGDVEGRELVRIRPTINTTSTDERTRKQEASPPAGLTVSVDGTVLVGSTLVATDVDVNADLEVGGHLTARHGLDVGGGTTIHGLLKSTSLKVGCAQMSSLHTQRTASGSGATCNHAEEAILEVDLPPTIHESPHIPNTPMLVRLGDMVRISASETQLQHRLAIETGGLRVASGGLEVGGGFVVHGGVDVLSGTLTLHGGLDFQNGGMSVASNETGGSVASAHASHEHFGGTVLELLHSPESAPDQSARPSFRFMEARNASGVRVASIDGDGLIVATGLHLNRKPAYLEAGLHLAGPTNLQPIRLLASNDDLFISLNTTYIELLSDGKAGSNNRFQFHGGDSNDNDGSRLLFIANADDDPALLPDGCIVPGKSLALLVRTSVLGWQSILAKQLQTNMSTLNTVAPSTHPGSRQLQSPEVKSNPMRRSMCDRLKLESFSSLTTVGGITFADDRKGLRTHFGLHFDGERLTVPRLRVSSSSIEGPLDLNGHILRNARIQGSSLVQADVVTTKAIRLVPEAGKSSSALPASTLGDNVLALIGAAGDIGQHPSLFFHGATGRLCTPRLSGHAVDGHVLFENGAELRGASIRGGTAHIDAITVHRFRFLPLPAMKTTTAHDRHNEAPSTPIATKTNTATSVATKNVDHNQNYGLSLALLDEDGYLVHAASLFSRFARNNFSPPSQSPSEFAARFLPRVIVRQVESSNSSEPQILLAADAVCCRVNST